MSKLDRVDYPLSGFRPGDEGLGLSRCLATSHWNFRADFAGRMSFGETGEMLVPTLFSGSRGEELNPASFWLELTQDDKILTRFDLDFLFPTLVTPLRNLNLVLAGLAPLSSRCRTSVSTVDLNVCAGRI